MSVTSSLLSSELTPDHETISMEFDLIDEASRLQRRVDSEARSLFHNITKETVETSKGNILVAIQGKQEKKTTAIVTLHDIGQNHDSCFQSFFCFHQFKPLLNNFTVYHLNFPGQEENANELPLDYVYPSMEEMAGVVEEILLHYGLKNTICFGVGAGANVFIRLGLKDPKHVECLLLVNATVLTSTWSEWGYEKMSSHYLKTKGMTQFTEDLLLYHYFGKLDDPNTNKDIVAYVRDGLKQIRYPRNLALFAEQFSKRSAIRISRPALGQAATNTLKSGVLLITGDRSPMLDDTVDLNSKLDPSNSTWLKISNASSMVLDEQPNHVANAVVLFLQGYGHAVKLIAPALSCANEKEVHGPPAIC